MSFMDKKQDVYDIKITPYGKKLLSQGKFKPEYYAFFDDDILYDFAHSNNITAVSDIGSTQLSVEGQNDIQTRIKEETPYFKVLHNYTRLEQKNRQIFKYETKWKQTDSLTYEEMLAHGIPGMGAMHASDWQALGREKQDYYIERAKMYNMHPAQVAKIMSQGPDNDTYQMYKSKLVTRATTMKEFVGYMSGDEKMYAYFQPEHLTDEEAFLAEVDYENEVGILKNYTMYNPMGTSQLGVQAAPAWNLQCYRGRVTGSVLPYLKTSNYPLVNITQIDLECKHTTIMHFNEDYAHDLNEIIYENSLRNHLEKDELLIFEDGSYVETKKGEILLELSEVNVEYLKENFEIEAYLVEDPDTNKESWTRLFFDPELPIEDSFYAPYVNKKEVDARYKSVPPENRLSNYLEITFDEEIPKEILCKTRADHKKKNIFSDLNINCSDQEQFVSKTAIGSVYDMLEDDAGVIC